MVLLSSLFLVREGSARESPLSSSVLCSSCIGELRKAVEFDFDALTAVEGGHHIHIWFTRDVRAAVVFRLTMSVFKELFPSKPFVYQRSYHDGLTWIRGYFSADLAKAAAIRLRNRLNVAKWRSTQRAECKDEKADEQRRQRNRDYQRRHRELKRNIVVDAARKFNCLPR